MVKKRGIEHVPNYQPTDVFNAGIVASNLPSIRGLSIRPAGEILALGSIVEVGLRLPGIKTLGVKSTVTEFAPGEMLRIDSLKKSDADAYLEFILHEDNEQPGTEVQYEIEVEGRAFFVRMATPAIAAFVAGNTSPLVETYRNNIITYLDARAQQPTRKIS